MTATLLKIAAVLTAIGTIGGAATYAEIRPVVLREFYAAQRQLTFQEQLELCRVVGELGYSGQEVKTLTGC